MRSEQIRLSSVQFVLSESEAMKTKLNVRPLTDMMIQKLAECRKLQEETNQLCLASHFNTSLAGLYKRKFIDVKPAVVNGKEIMCVFITDLGIEYLRAKNNSLV